MSNIAIYDTGTNKVLKILKSVNTPDYSSRNDVVINPELPSVQMKYMKHDNGSIVEMTQEEKDAVDVLLAPSYADQRRTEYEAIDGDFHDAVAKCVQYMKDNDVAVCSEMEAMLTARANIKSTYPKPQ